MNFGPLKEMAMEFNMLFGKRFWTEMMGLDFK